ALSSIFEYQVNEIPKQDIDDVAVSSTRIREALIKGDIETANKYLGYPFELTGTIIRGDQIGRTIGCLTTNLTVHDSHKPIPAYGIYAVETEIDSSVPSIHTGTYINPHPWQGAQGM